MSWLLFQFEEVIHV